MPKAVPGTASALAVCVALVLAGPPGDRSFPSAPDPRASLLESSDPRIPTRDLHGIEETRDPHLLRPEAGEKPNRPSEEIKTRSGSISESPRTARTHPNLDRANRIDRQAGAR